MPRRSILSAAERESLLALPDNRDDLIRRYTLSESDLSVIRQRRGPANRLRRSGEMEQRRPQTDNASRLEARPKAPANPKYGAEPGKLFYTHISDIQP
jgi:hypothetical protein